MILTRLQVAYLELRESRASEAEIQAAWERLTDTERLAALRWRTGLQLSPAEERRAEADARRAIEVGKCA